MSSDLFRIVYCSRNTLCEAGRDAEMKTILAVSRRNNARDGVTGALLFNQGMFAQTLEGPFENVQATFERIQLDERHTEIVLLEAEPVETRLFSEWAMALVKPEDPAGANEILLRALSDTGAVRPRAILGLLDLLVRREPDWLTVPAWAVS